MSIWCFVGALQVKQDFMAVLERGGKDQGLAVQLCAASVTYTAGVTIVVSVAGRVCVCVFASL
jgi:hypothetical protein